MPTIDQLAPATAASDNDELLVSQSGIARKVTRAQVLAGVQPQLAISCGTLVGRASAGVGGPEPISIGANLSLTNGALSANAAPFNVASLAAGTVPASNDLVPLGQSGSNTAVPYTQFMSGLAGIGNVDISQLLVTPTGTTSPTTLCDLAANTLPLSGGALNGTLTLAADPVASLQAATKQYVDTRVSRSGDTLTGALVLAADPTAPLQAATKGYVDTQVATTLPTSGGSLTGSLTLAGDPSTPLQAATKQYVDGSGVVTFNARGGAVALASKDVTDALTFTPYNATNPSGYQTATSVTAAIAAGNSGAFSTLSSSGAVSGIGFSTYLASPPAIGCTAPAAGAFTTLVSGQITGATGGAITGFGTGVGQALGPMVNYQASGIPGLLLNNQVIVGRASPAFNDGNDLRIRRASAFSGGTSSNINSALVVDVGAGANDGTQNWAFLSKISAGSTVGGIAVGGYFQVHRPVGAASPSWALISEASDLSLQPSSVSGAIVSQEWDLGAAGLDDGANANRFGGVGVRQMIHAVFAQEDTVNNPVTEFTAGIWMGTQTNCYVDSSYCFQNNTEIRQALDTRGAIPPTGSTDPVAAVRMTAGHIIDFNGGAALNSAPGRYLQYATSGTARLRYMNGATELLSISDAGAVTVGNLSASGTVSGAGFTSLLAPYALVTNVPAGASSTPAMDGTAVAGTATTWARADHVHPTDTSRAPVASPPFTGTVGLTSAKWTGSTLSICQSTSGSQFMCLNDTGATLASFFNYRYISGTNCLVMEAAGASANLLLQGNGGGSVVLPLVSVTGGTINGTAIGGTTAASGKFTTFGANSATPSGKVTVTGSRSGNAALASLLTAMATFGLITDSSTA